MKWLITARTDITVETDNDLPPTDNDIKVALEMKLANGELVADDFAAEVISGRIK